MRRHNEHITIVSDTFVREQIDEILRTPNTFFSDCHVQYPADDNGAHLTKFFSIEPIGEDVLFNDWMAEDIRQWVDREHIECDVILTPNQPGVIDIAKHLAWTLGCDFAFLKYYETGRFGDKLVEGFILPGDKVLVFNGVTQQGRCVGSRLPSFVEQFGGQVVGAAVFAKGTIGLVKATEDRYGSKFYSAIQVDIPVYSAEDCPRCKAGDTASLQPWTQLLDCENNTR